MIPAVEDPGNELYHDKLVFSALTVVKKIGGLVEFSNIQRESFRSRKTWLKRLLNECLFDMILG